MERVYMRAQGGGSKGYNGWTELISSTETTVETGEPRAV